MVKQSFLQITITLSLFIPMTIWGQDFSFRRIGLEDGLSQSSVMTITQDKKGLLWFGTQDGLNRYDGYDFFTLKNEPFDPTSLSHNHIRALAIDKQEILWVGTGGGGINIYNPLTHSFKRITNEPENPNSLSNNYITQIYQDPDGQVWIGTQNGLNRVVINGDDPLSGEVSFERFLYNDSQPRATFQANIQSIFMDHTDMLWIGTRWGLFSFPVQNKDSIKSWFHTQKNADGQQGLPIYDIVEDSHQKLIICAADGLLQFDREKQDFVTLPLAQEFPSEGLIFRSLTINQKNDLLVGLEGNGIIIVKYDSSTHTYKQFYHLNHHPDKPGSLSDNWIYTASPDRFQPNSWWIGTALGGITHIQEKAKPFYAHYLKTDQLPVQSGTYIRSTLIDKEDHIWFSLEKGLVKQTTNSNRYEYFTAEPNNPKALQDQVIFTIIEDRKGRKWAGTYRGIHQVISLPGGKTQFKHFPYPEDCRTVLTFSITEDNNGQLLLGTATGLNVFDPETETYQGCSRVLDTLDGFRNGYFITDIHRDRNNRVWIATTQGLILVKEVTDFYRDLHKAKPIIFRHNPSDIYSLRNDAINSLAEDNEGNIWLGTMNGLIRVFQDSGKWRFDNYTENDGLANNVVYAVLSDSVSNTLWLSTNNGLSRFDLLHQKFDNYNSRDGLQGNEFNQGAFSQTPKGQFIYGGIGGYTRFFPSKIQQDTYPPQVFLTRFSGGDGTPRDLLHYPQSEIELAYTENTFTIEFVGINYTDPKRNTYEYRLISNGKNDEAKWIRAGNNRQLNMTNLPPGSYLLEVRSFNGDGITSSDTASLQIKIHPPFWRTPWFFLIMLSGIIGLFWLFHWSRVQVKVRRVVELERVRKSTAADFHDELGHKLTIISLFGEILKQQLASKEKSSLAHLDKIISTSNSLYYSMKDLLWVLDPEKDSVLDLSILLKDFGDELFDKTGIAFRTEGIIEKMRHYPLPMDRKRHIVLIFKEAMNNALKHSQAKNAVLSITIAQNLILTFTDDGSGFDVPEASNGHGLANLRERARKLDSQLKIVSDKSGTNISLITSLPKKDKKSVKQRL